MPNFDVIESAVRLAIAARVAYYEASGTGLSDDEADSLGRAYAELADKAASLMDEWLPTAPPPGLDQGDGIIVDGWCAYITRDMPGGPAILHLARVTGRA